MKIQFETNYDKIKPFVFCVNNRLESITLGRENSPKLESVMSTFFYKILDCTGLLFLRKSQDQYRYIIEVNNIRALECSLYIASQTHTMDKDLIDEYGLDKYKEIYMNDLKETLHDLGLDEMIVVNTWHYNEELDTMFVYLYFELLEEKINHCIYEIDNYIDKELCWEEE